MSTRSQAMYTGWQGCGLEKYSLISVSSQEKLSTSRPRLSLGHLRLVSKTNFRPNCAGHINKTSQFWAPWKCFTFTVTSAGAFCIHSRWVSKSSVDRHTLLTCASVKNAINITCTLTSRSHLKSYKRLVLISASSFYVSCPSLPCKLHF